MLDFFISAMFLQEIASITTSPLVGVSRSPAICKRVDFPIPDGPSRETTSPIPTLKLMFSKTLISFLP